MNIHLLALLLFAAYFAIIFAAIKLSDRIGNPSTKKTKRTRYASIQQGYLLTH
jgi:hypothetical protein